MSVIFITGKPGVSSLEFFYQFSHAIILKVYTCREHWADLLSSFADHFTRVFQFPFC